MRGGIFGYVLFDDNGEDITATGKRLDVDGETRSVLLAENRWQLNPLWSLTAEASFISDPVLIDALHQLRSDGPANPAGGAALVGADIVELNPRLTIARFDTIRLAALSCWAL